MLPKISAITLWNANNSGVNRAFNSVYCVWYRARNAGDKTTRPFNIFSCLLPFFACFLALSPWFIVSRLFSTFQNHKHLFNSEIYMYEWALVCVRAHPWACVYADDSTYNMIFSLSVAYVEFIYVHKDPKVFLYSLCCAILHCIIILCLEHNNVRKQH